MIELALVLIALALVIASITALLIALDVIENMRR